MFPPNIDGDIHHLGRFLGRTDIFVAKVTDTEMFGDTTDETKETKWLTLDEFKAQGRDLHKPIVQAAVRYINNKENIKDN